MVIAESTRRGSGSRRRRARQPRRRHRDRPVARSQSVAAPARAPAHRWAPAKKRQTARPPGACHVVGLERRLRAHGSTRHIWRQKGTRNRHRRGGERRARGDGAPAAPADEIARASGRRSLSRRARPAQTTRHRMCGHLWIRLLTNLESCQRPSAYTLRKQAPLACLSARDVSRADGDRRRRLPTAVPDRRSGRILIRRLQRHVLFSIFH